MIPLNYHHLYYFLVVALEGGITAAKEKLFLSAPTISAQIRELERDLGRPLFERRSGRLHLTDDGRFVLGYARRIFDLGGELRDALGDRPKHEAPRAQIGVIAGFPAAIYQSLAAFLAREFRGAHLAFRMGDAAHLAQELREHRLDLAVAEHPLEPREGDRFVSRLAARVPVRLAASAPAARRLRSLPRGLDGAPLVLPAPPWGLRHQVLEACARWRVTPEIVGETQDLELAWRLGIAGRAVVPVDERTLKTLGRSLVPLRLPRRPALSLPVYLTARERRWSNPLAARALERFRC